MAYFQAGTNIASSYDLDIEIEDRGIPNWQKEIKTIIGNKMKNKMISTGSFTFAKSNRNSKIRGRCRWLRRWTFHWRGEIDRNWFRGRNFLPMSIDVSEILKRWRTWLCSVIWWHW